MYRVLPHVNWYLPFQMTCVLVKYTKMSSQVLERALGSAGVQQVIENNLNLGRGEVTVGGNKSCCTLFCLSKDSFILIMINHNTDRKNTTNISEIL